MQYGSRTSSGCCGTLYVLVQAFLILWHVFASFWQAQNPFNGKNCKIFTNKQQIKIWQKYVQIIMECVEEKASYETNAAKNKEINILSVKKDKLRSRCGRDLSLNTMWARKATRCSMGNTKKRRKEEDDDEKKRSEVKWTQKLFGLKRNEHSRKNKAQKSKEIWKSFSFSFHFILEGEYENIYGISCIIRHAYVNRKTK